MNYSDEESYVDTEAAANMRRMLMRQVRSVPDPIHQSLMDLEKMGEPYNLETTLDYDDDTSDLDL